jgi:hypothetical protein
MRGSCAKTRSGSVQTKHQKHHVGLFENYLKDIRIVYGYPKVFWRTGLDLHGFMSRQHKYLHGTEARKLRYVPKVSCTHPLFLWCPSFFFFVNKTILK